MTAFLYAIMTVDMFYVGISIFFFNFQNGLAIPHEYCLSPLNRSDCGLRSTPVFSYYKPGSRCEIEFWRGCPTANKFNDEFQCSHFCIGKLIELNEKNDQDNNDIDTSEDRCSKPLDKGYCGSFPTTVYTYEDGRCQPAQWRGCTSINMFDDYNDCIMKCDPALVDWKEEIEAFDLEDVEEVDNIVEDFIKVVKVEYKNVVKDVIKDEIKDVTKEIETVPKKRQTLALKKKHIAKEPKEIPETTVSEMEQEEIAETTAATTTDSETEQEGIAETTAATTTVSEMEQEGIAETTAATTTDSETEQEEIAETTTAVETTTTDSGEADEVEVV